MASQKILIVTLGLVVVVATLALPLSAHPSLQFDAEDNQQEETRPGMRRLTWWRWGRRNNDKKEEVTTESPTTTEVPEMDFITTTKKPSRWRSWFSRAKEKISNAAKKVKGKYERGMSVVDSVAKNGFYKAGKAIVLGVKKVGNVTMKVGRKIKKGAKKIGSAVKRGYQKIRLKFSGPDEKFKILANRIKDKVESGDGRAVDLLKKLGIHITLSDQKITGSRVVNKNISVTEILQNEGMLSNKTSSSYNTALEEPEITASIDSTGINESVISGISTAEEYDEFHSAEDYLTSEPNITDTKVEYERETTDGISHHESPTSATDRNETRSSIQDTTTETSKSTFPEKFTFLTESSSQADMKHGVESTSSYFPTEERIANTTVTIPSTDSVSKEDSVSTKPTDASDSHLYLTTISPFHESTTHSLVDQPFEETLLSFTETTTQSINMNKTGDQTTYSTISPTTAADIHPAILVNTIHPLNLDISVAENTTSKKLDEYKTTTLQHSSAVSINRETSPTTEAISLSTAHDTSSLSVTSSDFVTTLSEETSSFASTITATAPTFTPTIAYASTTLTPTTSTSTLPPTTSTITATHLITSKIITNALAPTISISTTFDQLPTTTPLTTTTSTAATSIPTTTTIPSTTSTSKTTTLPPTISISKTTTLPSTTTTSTTTTPPPTTSTSTKTIPPPITSTSTTLPSTTSTSTTTTPPPTTLTSTTTTPPPTTSTSTTTTPPPTTSTSTTTTPPPTTSTSTTTTPPPTTSTSTTLPSTTSTPTTTTLPSTTSTSTTTTPPPTTSVATIPPTTTQPPPPTTTTSSTYPPTPTIKTHPPEFTETNKMHPPTSPSTRDDDSETIVEEAYVPPPFPDVFSDIEVHDRLREFYDNGDFSHAEMAELFNFDPDNYEYYKYDYNYEDYTQ